MSFAVTIRERDARAPTSGGFQPSATKERSYPRHRHDAESGPDGQEEERIPPSHRVAERWEEADRDDRDRKADRRLGCHGGAYVLRVGHLRECGRELGRVG